MITEAENKPKQLSFSEEGLANNSSQLFVELKDRLSENKGFKDRLLNNFFAGSIKFGSVRYQVNSFNYYVTIEDSTSGANRIGVIKERFDGSLDVETSIRLPETGSFRKANIKFKAKDKNGRYIELIDSPEAVLKIREFIKTL